MNDTEASDKWPPRKDPGTCRPLVFFLQSYLLLGSGAPRAIRMPLGFRLVSIQRSFSHKHAFIRGVCERVFSPVGSHDSGLPSGDV